MKLLFGLLFPLVLGGIVNPPISSSTEVSSLPYVTIDSDTVVKNYIRFFGHPENSLPASEELFVLDEQFGEYRQMMVEKYKGYQSIFDFEKKRSILGFDAPSLSSIDRVTVSIKFKIYKNWDIFCLFPQIAQEDFVIKSSNRYQPYSYYALHGVNGVSGSDTKLDHMSNYSIPYIGTVSDILALEDNLAAAVANDDSFFNITRREKNFEYVIDNPAPGNNYYSISSSNLATKQFYVVMPCYFDISYVWISVAGTNVDDEIVSDGLDDNGESFIDPITGSKYIDFGTDTPRSIYFTDNTVITEVRIAQSSIDDTRVLSFGDFDFGNNTFVTLVKSFSMLADGSHYTGASFVLLAGYDAVLEQGEDDYSMIRIYYESDGFAVYQNIVGTDGIENPISEPVAPGDSSSWWDDYFFNPLTDVFATLGLVFRIVLLVAGLGIIAMVVIFIVQTLNKSKTKGGKK